MKLAKVTVKRISDHSNINKLGYCDAIYVIGEILCRSAVILGDPGCYEPNDGSLPGLAPWILCDGEREFVSSETHGTYEKRIVSGLATRYPEWISCTFSRGLNGVQIHEINKLVKAILDN